MNENFKINMPEKIVKKLNRKVLKIKKIKFDCDEQENVKEITAILKNRHFLFKKIYITFKKDDLNSEVEVNLRISEKMNFKIEPRNIIPTYPINYLYVNYYKILIKDIETEKNTCDSISIVFYCKDAFLKHLFVKYALKLLGYPANYIKHMGFLKTDCQYFDSKNDKLVIKTMEIFPETKRDIISNNYFDELIIDLIIKNEKLDNFYNIFIRETLKSQHAIIRIFFNVPLTYCIYKKSKGMKTNYLVYPNIDDIVIKSYKVEDQGEYEDKLAAGMIVSHIDEMLEGVNTEGKNFEIRKIVDVKMKTINKKVVIKSSEKIDLSSLREYGFKNCDSLLRPEVIMPPEL